MRYCLSFLLLLGLCVSVKGQTSTAQIQLFASDPSGSCPARRIGLSQSSGGFFYCNPSTLVWTALAGGATTAYNLIQDEGSNLTARTTLNLAGAGVTCADGSGKTTCTVPGAGTGFYSQSFTTQTSVILTHNLATNSIIVQCYDATATPVYVEWNTLTQTDTNNATVTFTSAQSGNCYVNSASGGTSAGVTKVSGTGTINFSTAIPDGASFIGGTTITVTGANVGDPVIVGPSTNLASKIEAWGKVTAANTVTVEVFNNSGGAVTPGSATWTAQVFH